MDAQLGSLAPLYGPLLVGFVTALILSILLGALMRRLS